MANNNDRAKRAASIPTGGTNDGDDDDDDNENADFFVWPTDDDAAQSFHASSALI